MARIFCISNRVSLPDPETGEIKAGGLAIGVKAALESNGGGVWFGWNGKIENTPGRRKIDTCINDSITFLTIPLRTREYENYYKGMANENLWPLLHGLEDHIGYRSDVYRTYTHVNKIFARLIKPHLKPDDMIWVHDYHLIPLGKELKKLGVRNRIGYFNHTPMPGRHTLQSENVPQFLKKQYAALIDDLFDYDLIGLQSFRDFKNFCETIDARIPAPARFESTPVMHNNKTSHVGVYPISIETHNLLRNSKNEASITPHKNPEVKTLIGAERLDYTKGLTNRLEGFYTFLQSNPEYLGQIHYNQITPLSRADIEQYKKTIEETRNTVKKINREFGNDEIPPLDYTEDGLPREELMRKFKDSDAALVTPLIDGQNLVAKEYIAAQPPQDPGILILSETAGAAEELKPLGTLCINPENPLDIAQKIHTALTMPRGKRMEIYQKSISHLYKYDIDHWAESFLHALSETKNARENTKLFSQYYIPSQSIRT